MLFEKSVIVMPDSEMPKQRRARIPNTGPDAHEPNQFLQMCVPIEQFNFLKKGEVWALNLIVRSVTTVYLL